MIVVHLNPKMSRMMHNGEPYIRNLTVGQLFSEPGHPCSILYMKPVVNPLTGALDVDAPVQVSRTLLGGRQTTPSAAPASFAGRIIMVVWNYQKNFAVKAKED
jgi:hypothetical protein